MSRTPNPLAGYLDAQVDASAAGLTDADIAILQDIGQDIADLAASIAARLAQTSDARMVTTWDGRGERRATRQFSADDLSDAIAEGALGELDAFAVVKSAAVLRLSVPAVVARAA